jgi:hypothetical protein
MVERGGERATERAGGLESLSQRLYRVLTDGAPGPLRFNIQHGCQLRDAITKVPIPASATAAWRAAREVLPDGTQRNRVASWRVLHQHVLGRYDVAIQAPSWSSLVVLDIDRPELGAAAGDAFAELEADGRRDAVLAAVWRAYGFSAERQPVILSTPGGGYHVYLPHCRDERRRPDQHAWPVAWARQRHEHHLDRARLGLKPGRLELYPTGVPLRAPCGRGMGLLVPRNPDDPDDLQLELRHARWEAGGPGRRDRLRRDVPALVEAFVEALERARRPLEAWLEPTPARPAWGQRFGPFGDRCEDAVSPPASTLYQHRVDSSTRGGRRPPRSAEPKAIQPPARPPHAGREGHEVRAGGVPDQGTGDRRTGHLLHGRAFRRRIAQLTAYGLQATGERHDAALKLAYYHHVCRGLDVPQTVEELRAWLADPRHVSATKARAPGDFVDDTLREVRHYLEKHLPRGTPRKAPGAAGVDQARPAPRRAVLGAADEALVGEVAAEVRAEARAILAYVATYADATGRVPHPVTLSAATLEALVGQRRLTRPDGQRPRASVVAVEELQRLAVLAVHRNYAVGRHGRQFTCWYRFGSGERPPLEPDLGVVLGTRLVAEGALVVVHAGVGQAPRVRFASLQPNLVEALTAQDAWWVRMYQRRAFTPAEFFEADQRHVLPGPFRDRRLPRADRARPAPDALAAPPAAPSGPGGPSPPLTGPDPSDELEALRRAVALAEGAGDTDRARRAFLTLWAALRRPP